MDPFSYGDQDIKVIKAYSSKANWSVVQLHLDDAIDCNDLEAGSEIDDPWFRADPQNGVHFLDHGIWLVDAGDYDNTGKSELIFAIDRENRGGYEMFYDHMKKRAVFEFSYH